MFWYLLLVIVWVGGLTLYRPKPESLREQPISYTNNLSKSKAALLLGLLFIAVYIITSSYKAIPLDVVFALNNQMSFSAFTIVQLFTNIFVHFSLLHLLSNLSFLGLLSIYEKRVGSARFLKIFFVSAFFANASVLLYTEPVLSAGASAGIAGLAAAYFLDHKNLTNKQYLLGFLSVVIIFAALQLETFLDAEELGMNVDFLGHALGFLVGALLVKITPMRSQ